MRKLYTALLTLVVLLSTTTSVEALESKTIERHNGASAYAEWYETNDNATTYTYLSVTETNDGTDVYVSTYTYGPDYWSEKWGYTFTEDDVFSIDKKLNSASLSEIEINVNDWYTGETENIAVKANWIGTGDISRGSSSYSSRNGDYVWKGSDSSTSRDASATGSINGLDPGVNSYGSMCNFKSAYMSMEK
jgi:hypothetical protein